MAWIDYQKIFDIVTHRWIIKYLELTAINNKIILFVKKTVSSWKSIVLPYAEEKLIGTEGDCMKVTRYHHCYFALL